jgi:hypothetical protein
MHWPLACLPPKIKERDFNEINFFDILTFLNSFIFVVAIGVLKKVIDLIDV